MNRKGFILIDCLLSMSYVVMLTICLIDSFQVNVKVNDYLVNTNNEVKELYE